MFTAYKHKFTAHELVFTDDEHKFAVHKYKIIS